MAFKRPTVFRWIIVASLLGISSCKSDDVKTYNAKSMPSMPALNSAPAETSAPMGGMDMSQAHDLPKVEVSSQEIQWKLPQGWKEKPASSMRAGSFSIPGKNGMDSDLSIIPLMGKGGGDLDNINRWRGQINLKPITQAQLPQHMQLVTVGPRKMQFANFVSDEPLINGKYKQRLMAAFYTVGEKTCFFKMVGEDSNVQAAKPSFLEFLSGVRLQGDRNE